MPLRPPHIYSTVELAILAKAYLAATGMTESTLSRHAAGNDKTLSRLFVGADCTARTAERMSAWFDLNWPPLVSWPEGIQPRRGRPRRPRCRSLTAATQAKVQL